VLLHNENQCKTSNKRPTKPKKKFNSNKKRKFINSRSDSGSQQQKICFYCGLNDHLIINCPFREKSKTISYINDEKFTEEKLRSDFYANRVPELESSKSYYSISTIVYYLVLGFFIFLLLNVIYMQYIWCEAHFKYFFILSKIKWFLMDFAQKTYVIYYLRLKLKSFLSNNTNIWRISFFYYLILWYSL